MTNSKQSSIDLLEQFGANVGDEAERASYNARSKIMALGKKIRHMRTSTGLSQTELAEAVGMRQADISRLESGLAKNGPSVTTIARLAEACDYTFSIELQPSNATLAVNEVEHFSSQIKEVHTGLFEALHAPLEAPLKSRAKDIPLLVNEIVARLELENKSSIRLAPAAMMALCNYDWPGNTRELEILIESLTIAHPYEVIHVDDLPPKIALHGRDQNSDDDVETFSKTDDLKKINGIGPVIEKRLKELGITTFEQIAQFNSADVERITDAIDAFPGRIQRDDWVGSAKEQVSKTVKIQYTDVVKKA